MNTQIRFVIACCFLFFGLGNLLLWVRNSSFLHWPLYILGGAALATVSNYSLQSAFPFNVLPHLFDRPGATPDEDI
jgi:hypothetical protein